MGVKLIHGPLGILSSFWKRVLLLRWSSCESPVDGFFFFFASLFNVYKIIEAAENICTVSLLTQTLVVLCLVDSEDLTLAPNSAIHLPWDLTKSFSHSWPQCLYWWKRNIIPILTNSQADRGRPNEKMNVWYFINHDYQASQCQKKMLISAPQTSASLHVSQRHQHLPTPWRPPLLLSFPRKPFDCFFICRVFTVSLNILILIYFQPFILKWFWVTEMLQHLRKIF